MNKKLLTSLKISKALKQAGFKVESEYKWLHTISGYMRLEERCHDRKQFEMVYGTVDKEYNAYLTDELLGALPIEIKEGRLRITVGKKWVVWYGDFASPNKSLPEALAEMVLWCIKEGHI